MRLRRPADEAERPAFDLLDEAIDLLRRTPLGAWLIWGTGALPFSLGALAFQADMSRGAHASERLPEWALLLALLFLLFKTAQALFCGRLDALLREGEPDAPRAPLLHLAALQAAAHGAALFFLPIVASALLPLGWGIAAAQNVTVLGARERRGLADLLRRAHAQAVLWPRQNHILLAILAAFSLAVLVNVAGTLLLAPSLARTLTGSENVVTRSGLHAFNSTLVAAALVLTWLALDPLVKAAYTLRCFHGESLATGEDLLLPLRRLRARRAAALLVLLLVPLPALPAAAAGPPARVSSPALDRAIDEVLRAPEYDWRSRVEREPLLSEGPVSGFLLKVGRASRKALRVIGDWGKKLLDLLRDLLAPSRPSGAGDAPRIGWGEVLRSRALLFALLAVVGALAAVFVLRTRRRRRAGVVQAAAEPAALPLPDPLLETTTADLRDPEDWLVLAREWIDKGDLRRALRALYLGALGTLSRAGLVRLAPARSNGEYARELRRRAADREELLAAFGALVAEFERAWYGRHAVTEESLARVNSALERVRAHAA